MTKAKLFFMATILLLLAGCSKSQSSLSINKMYLGMKTSDNMQEQVMDASYQYYYKDVGFDVDGNDCIEYMEFYCSYNAESEVTCGLSDINLLYQGKRLKTTDDIIECFGQEYVSDGEKYESFIFEDGEMIVEVSLLDGEFNGIEITKN